MADLESISRDALLAKLRALEESGDGDMMRAHMDADQALLAYIADAEIAHAFNVIGKWYA
jgi:hypothetical protein